MRNSIIILASGTSARFGSNKLMEFFRGRRLIEYAIMSALLSFQGEVYIVKSPELRIADTLGSKVKIIENDRPDLGISHSIALGVQKLRNKYDSVIVSLGDQPFVPSYHYRKLYEAAVKRKEGIVYTKCGERMGNPTLFKAKYFGFLSTMYGDFGARSIISDNFADSFSVDIDNCDYLMDIDTLEDLARAREIIDRLYPEGLY